MPSRGGLFMSVVVVVVGLPGTMCYFSFISVVGVITFLYDLVSDYVLGVGCVELLLYCLVVLHVCWMCVSKECVVASIAVGFCVVCNVVCSGVPIVICGRVFDYYLYCRAVFTS
jgi:hypothetical protein